MRVRRANVADIVGEGDAWLFGLCVGWQDKKCLVGSVEL